MSQIRHGSMSKSVSVGERDEYRRKFLEEQSVTMKQTILVRLLYEGDNYCRFRTVGLNESGDGITRESSFVSDALFTKEEGIALLLPVADCVGMVVYDSAQKVLGLVHLGRHNLLQNTVAEAIRYMHESFGTSPGNVHVWLSAAAGKNNYPLHDFDKQSMHEVVSSQLFATGVLVKNVTLDIRDTTTDLALFSHSEFLKGNRQVDGRQAVVAMMK